MKLPDGLDYQAIGGLSSELSLKLQRFRPASIADAKKIEGMTPAGLVVLMARVRGLRASRKVRA